MSYRNFYIDYRFGSLFTDIDLYFSSSFGYSWQPINHASSSPVLTHWVSYVGFTIYEICFLDTIILSVHGWCAVMQQGIMSATQLISLVYGTLTLICSPCLIILNISHVKRVMYTLIYLEIRRIYHLIGQF